MARRQRRRLVARAVGRRRRHLTGERRGRRHGVQRVGAVWGARRGAAQVAAAVTGNQPRLCLRRRLLLAARHKHHAARANRERGLPPWLRHAVHRQEAVLERLAARAAAAHCPAGACASAAGHRLADVGIAGQPGALEAVA
eukprot:365679-Chlamydomonas_euryale.AAC.2